MRTLLLLPFLFCSCSGLPQAERHYAIYATVQYNRVDSLKLAQVVEGLMMFSDACLVSIAVDTLNGDTVNLGMVQDLIVAPQDTSRGLK